MVNTLSSSCCIRERGLVPIDLIGVRAIHGNGVVDLSGEDLRGPACR